jgi:hypothetical protein
VETTTSNVIVVVPGQSSNQSNGRKYHGREKSDYGSIVRVSGVWKLIQSLIFLILLWRPPVAIEEEERTRCPESADLSPPTWLSDLDRSNRMACQVLLFLGREFGL